MQILITGAAGFIGSHLCEDLLSKGHEITGIDNFDPFYARAIKEDNLIISLNNLNFKFYEIDITYQDAFSIFEDKEFDVIIHLAAKAGVRPSIVNPQQYFNANITGTLNVLEFMRKINCKKLIFASSSSIYGNNIKVPFEESDCTDFPISPYAVSKKSCELLNYTYHQLYNFDILNLRFFTVYGPRQRPDLAIHKFTDKISKKERIEIYGDGTTARDYTFVGDTVNGIIGALNYVLQNDNIYEIINLGNNKPIALNTLVKGIEDALNQKANLQYKPMQDGDVNITYAHIEKAKALLGYAPQTSLERGLKEFVAWYAEKNARNLNSGS